MEFVLEDSTRVGLFWRVQSFPSTAIDRAASTQLRRCLKLTSRSEVNELTDDEVRAGLVTLLRRGELVAVRDEGLVSGKWGVGLGSPGIRVRLIPRNVIQATRNNVLVWLNSAAGAASDMENLRRVLKVVDKRYLEHLKDDDLISYVRGAFKRRELIVLIDARYHFIEDVADSKPMEPAAAAPRPDPVEQEESWTFEPGHAAGPQVQTLVAAAESGVPFCEVCAQQAAARAAQ